MGKYDPERALPLEQQSLHPLREECDLRGISYKESDDCPVLRKKIVKDSAS